MRELSIAREPEGKDPGEYSDVELIEGIRNRDELVFKYLQSRYKHGIRLLVCTNGGNRDDAEDIFNDGILRLMEIVDRYNFTLTCKLPTLLYAICEKKWKLLLLKRRISRKYPFRKQDETPVDDFTDNIDKDLRSEVFWEGFRKLETDCKRILKAYFFEIPGQDIAKIMDYSYGYLRKKKSQCMKYLVEIINSHPDFKKIRHP